MHRSTPRISASPTLPFPHPQRRTCATWQFLIATSLKNAGKRPCLTHKLFPSTAPLSPELTGDYIGITPRLKSKPDLNPLAVKRLFKMSVSDADAKAAAAMHYCKETIFERHEKHPQSFQFTEGGGLKSTSVLRF